MLKKKMLGMGIVGIGVLVFMLTSSANPMLFIDWYTNSAIQNQYSTDVFPVVGGGPLVSVQSNIFYQDRYSMLVDCPTRNDVAWVASPAMSPHYTDTCDYDVEFKFKLSSAKYQFFHICYDGFINLVVENTLNGLELRYVTPAATTTLTAIAPGWHTILIDVQHGVMQNPAFYRVKLDNGLNWMNAVKFSDTNLPNLYFGVDVAKSGYGKVYFDDIWVYHFLPGNRYGNYDLFATFEQDSNGVLHGWSIDPTTTGTVCPDSQVVHNDDQVSLRIRSPRSQQPAIDNRAWVNTMNYPLNDAHDYELSLDIYIPSGMQCNFFHIAFNRHVDLVIKGPNADGTYDIHAVTGPNQGQMQLVAKLNTGWHFIKCPVNVEAPVGGHKSYDLYIDWPANPNPVKANIQCYSDGNADHYIGMGDDNENGQAPVDRNFGELYYDNVRIEQFY